MFSQLVMTAKWLVHLYPNKVYMLFNRPQKLSTMYIKSLKAHKIINEDYFSEKRTFCRYLLLLYENIWKVSHSHDLTSFGFYAFFYAPNLTGCFFFCLVGVNNDMMHSSSQFWKMCSTDTFAGAVIGCYSTLSHLSVTNKHEVSPWTMQA